MFNVICDTYTDHKRAEILAILRGQKMGSGQVVISLDYRLWRPSRILCEVLLGQFTPLYLYLKPKPGEVLEMTLEQAASTLKYLKETN